MAQQPPPLPPASVVDAAAYTRQSRTYEPQDPDLRDKRVKPFRLDELERVPREYRDIHQALHRLLPEAAFEAGFVGQVRQLLQQYTELDIDLWLHSVRVLKRTDLRAMIPGHTCLAVVGLEPMGEKMLLEIDLAFAYRVVDQLLGGHGIAVDIHRPLTEIEQGVFSYLLLKALALFQTEMSHGEQVALRLEDLRTNLKSCADIVRYDDFWLVASWKMNFDLDVGFVRVLLPTSLARRVVPERPPPDSALAERIRGRIRQRMNRLAGITVDGAVEVGRIELMPSDLAALDPGDIILLDECLLTHLGPDGAEGAARMHVGLGQNGVVHGQVGVQDGPQPQLVFQVTHIEIAESPGTHDPHEVHGQHGNPEQVMAEYEDPAAYEEGAYEEGYEENDDGPATPEDVRDEDWGLDDESEGEGDDEAYGDYEEGYDDQGYEDGYAEDGNYQEQGYEEQPQGYEEQPQGYDDQGYAQGGDDIPIDDADNLAEAEPLLGDIPVSVVVELGRVQLTADEVIRLRAGHLMELGRSPADPVDLVVNGKLLAKGELVEIEGALGVKILNLMKESE